MAKMRLMVVDDEERFLTSIARVLARYGYEVISAGNGLDALDKLAKHPVDVMILDVKMPVMDGLTCLKEVKQRFPLVEVIMLTGHATVDSAIEGLKDGAFDYLIKPCKLDELMMRAEEAYDRKRVQEEKQA